MKNLYMFTASYKSGLSQIRTVASKSYETAKRQIERDPAVKTLVLESIITPARTKIDKPKNPQEYDLH